MQLAPEQPMPTLPEPELVSTSSSGRTYRLTAPDGHTEDYRYEPTPEEEEPAARKRRLDRNRRDRQRAESRLDPAKHALARAQDNARKLKSRVARKHAAGQTHSFRPVEHWSEEERNTLLELVLELRPASLTPLPPGWYHCCACKNSVFNEADAFAHVQESLAQSWGDDPSGWQWASTTISPWKTPSVTPRVYAGKIGMAP